MLHLQPAAESPSSEVIGMPLSGKMNPVLNVMTKKKPLGLQTREI